MEGSGRRGAGLGLRKVLRTASCFAVDRMKTRDERSATGRDATASRAAQDDHASGLRPRFVLADSPRGRDPHAADIITAMVSVNELLRDASKARDAFGRLVQIVDSVFPVEALSVVSANTSEDPLVWTTGAPGLEPVHVAAIAGAALHWFQADPDPRADKLLHDEAWSQPWISLPIVANDGGIVGLLAVAPASDVDEATLSFVASVATSLAQLLVREARLERVHAARDRTEWLSRTNDLRLLEERRARSAAEWSAHALGVASDATAVMLSSFDYAAVLRHAVRIVAEHLACGCVVDVYEPDGIDRIAEVSSHPEPIVALALAPLVLDVSRGCASSASVVGTHPLAKADPRYSALLAERARRALDVEWIVSVPLTANGSSAVGVMTMFGSGPRHEPIPIAIAEELGRRAASAVENGRRYSSAVAALRQREQVLSMVSHDLKNPLGVIVMSVAHVLEAMPPDDRRTPGRPQLELIQRAARRMMKLVGDLLDLAAMDEGKISMVPRRCPMGALVSEVFADLQPQASAAGVELACEVPDGLPPAWADSHRVIQVLTNLVSNSLRFTPRGGRVSARAAVIAPGELALMIDDTGQGIASGHLPHVFDRFWQGPMGAKTGSGLGLTICRGIVERSGGKIWVESMPGIGTTFTFTLPVA